MVSVYNDLTSMDHRVTSEATENLQTRLINHQSAPLNNHQEERQAVPNTLHCVHKRQCQLSTAFQKGDFVF